MHKFESIDHTADTGILIYGKTVQEVFVNAAYGMFSIISDMETVSEEIQREIFAEAIDQEELLVTWLNELLYHFDAENIVFCRFDIVELTDERMKAIAYGEKAKPSRHNLKTHVKAATYHSLKIEKGDGFRAQVIFDV